MKTFVIEASGSIEILLGDYKADVPSKTRDRTNSCQCNQGQIFGKPIVCRTIFSSKNQLAWSDLLALIVVTRKMLSFSLHRRETVLKETTRAVIGCTLTRKPKMALVVIR